MPAAPLTRPALERYLDRIGHTGTVRPDADTLIALHRAHMLSVPFENLDVIWRRPIILDEARFFAKIVEARRGGFCFEQNGLFAWALGEIGYRVERLSVNVLRPDGAVGIDFGHIALRVELDAAGAGNRVWLADVGFGDSFREPLPLDDASIGVTRAHEDREYRLDIDGGTLTLHSRDRQPPDAVWTPRYRFQPIPRPLAAFAGGCRFHTTSPESPFTQRRVCSQALADGRLTLTDTALIETRFDGERLETPVGDEAEFARLLAEKFGIETPVR